MGSIEKSILDALDTAGYYVVQKKDVDALFKRSAEIPAGWIPVHKKAVPNEQTVESVPNTRRIVEKAKRVLSKKQEKAEENEERVLAAIVSGKTKFKEIARKSKVPVGSLSVVFSRLIKSGKIIKSGFGKYELAGNKKPVYAEALEEESEASDKDNENEIEEDTEDIQEAFNE